MKYVDSNKYDKSIVKKYILGGEIKEFDLDELENDYEFMLQVLNETRDKNMLNLCSKEMLENPKFVLGLIRIFNDDEDFIVKTAHNFLAKDNAPSMPTAEIMVEAYDCLRKGRKKDEDLLDNWFPIIEAKMFIDSVMAESLICAEKDGHGIGFSHIQYRFMGNEYLQKFFAKELINEKNLFENYEKFEKQLHKTYKSSKSITNRGINTFVIEYIRMHDIELGEFISTRLDLIQREIKMVQNIVNNWDEYEQGKIDDIDAYISSSLFNGPYRGMINYIELITYLNQEMDINEIHKIYERASKHYILDDENDNSIETAVDEMKSGDFELRKWLTELKQHIGYMSRNGEIDTYTINSDLIDEKNEKNAFVTQTDKPKQKIIEFKPNNDEK